MNGTIDLIARLATEFDRRGWRDPGDAAQSIARALIAGDSPRQAAAKVSSRFLATNSITREEVRALIETLRLPGSSAALRNVAIRTDPHDPSAVEQRGLPAPRAAVRFPIALVFTTLWTALIWAFPTWIDWKWLLDHENELAIRALAQVVITTAGIGLALWNWKVLVASITPIIPLLGLLGSSHAT